MLFQRNVSVSDIDPHLASVFENKEQLIDNVDFKCPWKDVSLHQDHQSVTTSNVDLYLKEVREITIGSKIQKLCEAFKNGFNEILDFELFHVFSGVEFIRFFSGQTDYSFSEMSDGELNNAVHFDKSIPEGHRMINMFFTLLRSLTNEQCSRFVLFLTGTTSLPAEGLIGITPQISVTLVTSRNQTELDIKLPTCSACSHHLKVPDYSNENIFKEKLIVAIFEGSEQFLMS